MWKVVVFLAVICLVWQYMLPQSYVLETWDSNVVKPAKQIYERATVHIFGNESKSGIPIGEPVRGRNNIMFVETSCLVKKANATRKVMSLRQTCSIESAARMNPDADVYLLHSCPIEFNPDEPVTQLLKYTNIKFWSFSLHTLMSGTPLQAWDYNAALGGSQWPLEHSSDVVRFVLLWKYGGIYMDLDFVVIKSMDSLEENFVCIETEKSLGSSVIKMDSENTGHKLATICVEQLAKDFRGDAWAHNGPQRITDCLQALCHTQKLSDVDPKECNVTIYNSSVFFPVAYWEWKMLFSESDSEKVAERIENSSGVHVWNKLSFNEKVYIGSIQP
ncbi:hypothetical protein L9F63_018745, partial [Diploptera punctata]